MKFIIKINERRGWQVTRKCNLNIGISEVDDNEIALYIFVKTLTKTNTETVFFFFFYDFFNSV